MLGVVWTVVALGVVVYAYIMQRKRLYWIDVRHPGHFDELAGPVVLCATLAIAVLVNLARTSVICVFH